MKDKIPNHGAGIIYSTIFGVISALVIMYFRMAGFIDALGVIITQIIALILVSFLLGRTVRSYLWVLVYTYLFSLILIPLFFIGDMYYASEMYIFYNHYDSIGLAYYYLTFMILWAIICVPCGLLGVVTKKKKN